MRSGMAGMMEVVLARRRRLLMMRRVQGVSRMEMLRPMRRSRLRVIRVVRMMARMLELGMVKMMCQRPVFGMCSNTLCVPAPPHPPSVFFLAPGGSRPP